jgi:hypothetical protein
MVSKSRISLLGLAILALLLVVPQVMAQEDKPPSIAARLRPSRHGTTLTVDGLVVVSAAGRPLRVECS